MPDYEKMLSECIAKTCSLLETLKKVDSCGTYEFVRFISKLSEELEDAEEEFTKILSEKEIDFNVRLCSFFALCTMHRRKMDYTKYEKLFKNYESIFGELVPYKFLKIAFYKERNIGEDIKIAIDLLKEIRIEDEENPANYQIYSDTIAEGFIHNFLSRDNNEDKNMLNNALKYIKKAIVKTSEEYHKYYATLANIQIINEEYRDAIDNIKAAIDKADSNSAGYSLLMNNYKNLIIKAEIKRDSKTQDENMQKLIDCTKKIKKEINKYKRDNLISLSFFVAVLSLIMGTVNIVAKGQQEIVDSMRLIICLCGILIISIGSFGFFILEWKRSWRKAIILFVLGILITTFAIFFFPE